MFLAVQDALKSRAVLGVTCRGKTDGGGAQIHAVMSAQVFAKAMGARYFHTSLSTAEHAPGDTAEWAGQWEAAFGLSRGHADAETAGPIISVERFLSGYDGPPAILEAPYFHDFCDADPDRYLLLRDEFRASCQLLCNTPREAPVAAVHIRRGDVAEPGSRFANRLTSMAHNAAAIRHIQDVWPGIKVQVFSQGAPDDFAELPNGCTLHLDTDVFETLAALMNADVLVTAKSSFSYVAALLSRGTVLYEPFWHKPLSSWIVRSTDGLFDLSTTKRAVGA